MDKVREEFEKYCADEELGMTGSDCTGEYYNPVIEMLWHCWVSSRKRASVELPENCKGMALTVSELRHQLGKAGVSLK